MKKNLSLICVLSLTCLLLSACNDAESSAQIDSANVSNTASVNDGKNVVEIKEKLFIEQCNDIYNNTDSYKDKTIIIEGICGTWEEDGEMCYSVYRNAPGCCGADGQQGFRFRYDGDVSFETDDWIAITGTVELETMSDGTMLPILEVMDLTVKAERGAEFVSN